MLRKLFSKKHKRLKSVLCIALCLTLFGSLVTATNAGATESATGQVAVESVEEALTEEAVVDDISAESTSDEDSSEIQGTVMTDETEDASDEVADAAESDVAEINEETVSETETETDAAEETVAEAEKESETAAEAEAESEDLQEEILTVSAARVEEEEETVETLDADETVVAIYLNGESGDDSNAGTSADAAVKTFKIAKSFAEKNGLSTIYITGTVTISEGSESRDGGGTLSLVRDSSLKNSALVELTGGSLTLSNITVDGNEISSTAALIRVNGSSSVLTIQSGTVIQNNRNTSTSLAATVANNAAICVVNGKLVMTGGEIKNNIGNSWGGGIALTANGSSVSAEMELTGGTISGNSATCGGGIYMYGNATLVMSGGTVTGNYASSYGGGIYVGCGGVATISAGYITNNKCTGSSWGGGGIYVNSAQSSYAAGKLYLYNAEIAYNKITGETAEEDGYSSAISSCQTGSVEVNVTDGSVIHDNDTAHTIQVYQDSTSSSFILSPIMLGGGAYNWKDFYGNAISTDALTYTNAGWIYADTSVSVSDGNVTGLSRVKTYVLNNESVLLGAAIGTNGEVYIGKSDGNVTINIEKQWKEISAENQKEVTIDIYATDGSGTTECIGSVTLSNDNEWKTTITNLPKYDTDGLEYTYSVQEESGNSWFKNVTGGKTTASGEGTYGSDEDKTAEYDFVVTNTAGAQLTLEQSVVGTTTDEDFVFELTFYYEGEPYSGTLEIVNTDGSRSTLDVEDGVAELNLSDGESITLILAVGMKYTVTETNSRNALDVTYCINEENALAGNTVSATIADDTILGFINNYETVSVSVNKTWDDADDQDGIRPESITVRLYADGVETDSAEITEADGWTYTFIDLQKYSNGVEIEYTISEDAVDEYTSVITGDASNGYVITNSYTPEEIVPDTPDEPDSSVDTTTETTTDVKTETTTDEIAETTTDTTTESASANAKTGDTNTVYFWILIIAAAACVVVLTVSRKRKNS
ncbi:MAG: Cna B-type domain-containing protein [Clostridiales bacterium]|nr:Cna B-type domain-containing protein [Clostridiales bacterium]